MQAGILQSQNNFNGINGIERGKENDTARI